MLTKHSPYLLQSQNLCKCGITRVIYSLSLIKALAMTKDALSFSDFKDFRWMLNLLYTQTLPSLVNHTCVSN
ncbi:hypothetical protein A7X13_02850 [Helicobacter pullorum]|nr:hypothetical protein A7X13_02850 [Helicobacter pullorum]